MVIFPPFLYRDTVAAKSSFTPSEKLFFENNFSIMEYFCPKFLWKKCFDVLKIYIKYGRFSTLWSHVTTWMINWEGEQTFGHVLENYLITFYSCDFFKNEGVEGRKEDPSDDFEEWRSVKQGNFSKNWTFCQRGSEDHQENQRDQFLQRKTQNRSVRHTWSTWYCA